MVCEHNGAYQGPVGLLVQEAGPGVQLAKSGYPLKNKVYLLGTRTIIMIS